uniref:NADH-ubiquinone oxidoreductase chain 6 n=1 Tax=Phloeopora testacea TaxID=347434 RepID=A0A0S2M814_9COLE|nr:NADH deshydrogenase subunit 6 [Phloeopora testacea]
MLFFTMNFLISFTFLFLNHPMTVGLMLLMQTINISMITGLLHKNFWFSYVLFLIMIGGMLVLFIYMTSIASNEIFYYNNNILIMIFMFLVLMICSLLFIDNYLINIMYTYAQETLIMKNFLYSLNKFFNYPSMLIIFVLIIYLFITLIATVKITNINYGPLRQNL